VSTRGASELHRALAESGDEIRITSRVQLPTEPCSAGLGDVIEEIPIECEKDSSCR
jgi:hypothetical protein